MKGGNISQAKGDKCKDGRDVEGEMRASLSSIWFTNKKILS